MIRKLCLLLLLIASAIVFNFLYSHALGAIPCFLLSFFLFYLAKKEWQKRPIEKGQIKGNGQGR